MRLAIFVESRILGIVSHAYRTRFVNRGSPIVETVRGWAVGNDLGRVRAASSLDNGAKSLLHILRHSDFVLARVPMKAQRGYAPLIRRVGVKLAIRVLIGNHLSQCFHADRSAIRAAAMLL